VPMGVAMGPDATSPFAPGSGSSVDAPKSLRRSRAHL
jgi:hypothetical protein